MARTSTDPKPAAPVEKPNPGVPAVYLADNGRFKMGLDARLKADLVNAILGTKDGKELHTFTKTKAQALLDARDWSAFLTKAQASRAAKAERKAAKAEAKLAA